MSGGADLAFDGGQKAGGPPGPEHPRAEGLAALGLGQLDVEGALHAVQHGPGQEVHLAGPPAQQSHHLLLGDQVDLVHLLGVRGAHDHWRGTVESDNPQSTNHIGPLYISANHINPL